MKAVKQCTLEAKRPRYVYQTSYCLTLLLPDRKSTNKMQNKPDSNHVNEHLMTDFTLVPSNSGFFSPLSCCGVSAWSPPYCLSTAARDASRSKFLERFPFMVKRSEIPARLVLKFSLKSSTVCRNIPTEHGHMWLSMYSNECNPPNPLKQTRQK